MKERPILFSIPMVRALRAGKKWQTRRAVRLWQGNDADKAGYLRYDETTAQWFQYGAGGVWCAVKCPFGVRGDRLWVRETWTIEDCGAHVSVKAEAWPTGFPMGRVQYVADDPNAHYWNKRPAIFMPRWACRMVLEVVDTRIERLHACSPEDAMAEGVGWNRPAGEKVENPVACYEAIWEAINGVGTWANNPWVWVIDFRRISDAKA